MTPATHCERTERVHLFADGELTPPEAEEVRMHLPGCAECQRVLDEVLQLDVLVQTSFEGQAAEAATAKVHDLAAAREKRGRRSWRVVGVVSAIAAAAVVVLVARPGNDVDPYHLGEARPLEARLTHQGASEYRRYEVARSGEAHGAAVPLETMVAMEKKGDADGVATGYLLRGERSQALETLAHAKGSPEIDSDRAVAALVGGDAEGALTLVDAVLRASPAHAEALWNRGLALRDLGLPLAAAEAFDQVAAKNEPGWSTEAKERAAALRKGLSDRAAAWKAADAAGRDLMIKHQLPSEEIVRLQPGLFRLYLYDAVRTAPDAAAVSALHGLAAQLDAISGGDVLMQLLARVAKADFAARAPIAASYVELADGKLDSAHVAQMLALSEKAHQPDLRMGVLLQAHALGPNLDEYKKLAADSRDPWFEAISAQTEAASLVSTRPLVAEQILRSAIEKAQAAHLDYRVLLLRLSLGELLKDVFYRVPEAFAESLAAFQLATASGNPVREQAALYALSTSARLRWGFALARAYLREALLRYPDDCAAQHFAHETAANIALIEQRPAEARAEFDAIPACGRGADLQTVGMLGDLARSTNGRPEDVRRLEEMLKSLRESGSLSPGQKALADHLEGQMLLASANPAATHLLLQSIDEADALPGDSAAQEARAFSYVALELQAVRTGHFKEALDLLGKEERVVPGPCTLGVGADDASSFVVVMGADAAVIGSYDAHSAERLDRFVPKPSAAQLAALHACEEISVLARPPLEGRTGILPADVAWSYGMRPATNGRSNLSRTKRLIVADASPPSSLGLPRLGSWSPSKTPEPKLDDQVELRGPLATPSRVLAEMEKATEIDVDAHGLVDVAVSDASLIALSADTDGTWALSAADVRTHKLLGRPLVILAACRAAVGVPRLHAPWSLPAAFLQAGASAVFASRDDIPDAQARDFFDVVLTGIHSGKSARIALRDARIDFRSRPNGAWVDSVLLFE